MLARLLILASISIGLPYLAACADTPTTTASPDAAAGEAEAAKRDSMMSALGAGNATPTGAPASSQQYGGAAVSAGSLRVDSNTDPSIPILDMVVTKGQCVKLERMPGILSQLGDPEFRLKLGKVVAEGRRKAGAALTEWLVLASKYQELCQLYGAEEHNADKYITDSIPMEESVMENAVKRGRCQFLATADANQAWPYEVRMGQEVLRRDFNEAEITRQLWKSMLQDYLKVCGGTLSRRGQIRAETVIRRLDRIIGLDDPTLINLRSNMLDALERGNEKKVIAYAKVIAEREVALDSRRSGEYEAKLASIESELKGQRKVMAAQSQAMRAAVQEAKAAPGAGMAQTSNNAANTAANVAETAQNVAKAAKAAKTTAKILRSFF